MRRRVALPVIANVEPIDVQRPRVRGDCELPRGKRPCPYVACRFHLCGIGVSFVGRVLVGDIVLTDDATEAQVDAAIDVMVERVNGSPETCALDVVARRPDGSTLAEVAAPMRLTRERVRQVESKALRKLPPAAKAAMLGVDKRELHEPRSTPMPRDRPRSSSR